MKKAKRFEIMKQTVTLYGADDEKPLNEADGFFDMEFNLTLPEDVAGEEVDKDGGQHRMALPPSFRDLGDDGKRYM